VPLSRGNRGSEAARRDGERGREERKKKKRAKKRRSEHGFGGGGKPEKLRTEEIKLMSFLEGAESAGALDFPVCRRRVGDVVFRRRAVD